MLIVAKLIDHKQCNQHEAGDANGHATDVDQRKQLIFNKVPKTNFEIILQHTR
jgi:hypothetical protein